MTYLIIFDEEGRLYIHNKKDKKAAQEHADKLHSSIEWRIVERVSIEVL